jgi:WD40 repeat protein
VELWDARTLRHLGTLTGELSSPEFSPDGRLLAAGAGSAVRLWDLALLPGGPARELPPLKGVPKGDQRIAFSHDGRTLAVSSVQAVDGARNSAVTLWNLASRRRMDAFAGIRGEVIRLRFSPDGKILAGGGSSLLGREGIIRLWDIPKRRELPSLRGHNGIVMSVDISPDGKTLASGSADRTVKLWNLLTGQEAATFTGQKGLFVAFSPDGNLLASDAGYGQITLFRAATLKETEVPVSAR